MPIKTSHILPIISYIFPRISYNIPEDGIISSTEHWKPVLKGPVLGDPFWVLGADAQALLKAIWGYAGPFGGLLRDHQYSLRDHPERMQWWESVCYRGDSTN